MAVATAKTADPPVVVVDVVADASDADVAACHR